MLQKHKQTIQFHFQHISSNIPNYMVNIHTTKKKQIPKSTLPIKNHVLYEFSSSEIPLKVSEESNPDTDRVPDPVPGLVDFIVDSYMDMGELYSGEREQNENTVEYNPMNFSLRHYISSK